MRKTSLVGRSNKVYRQQFREEE